MNTSMHEFKAISKHRMYDQYLVMKRCSALGQQITGLVQQDDGTFLLTSATGDQHWTRTAVLAVGYVILKIAKLEIEEADRYEVTNLHYTVQELESFRGKHVLISGGGDSAVDLGE